MEYQSKYFENDLVIIDINEIKKNNFVNLFKEINSLYKTLKNIWI